MRLLFCTNEQRTCVCNLDFYFFFCFSLHLNQDYLFLKNLVLPWYFDHDSFLVSAWLVPTVVVHWMTLLWLFLLYFPFWGQSYWNYHSDHTCDKRSDIWPVSSFRSHYKRYERYTCRTREASVVARDPYRAVQSTLTCHPTILSKLDTGTRFGCMLYNSVYGCNVRMAIS